MNAKFYIFSEKAPAQLESRFGWLPNYAVLDISGDIDVLPWISTLLTENREDYFVLCNDTVWLADDFPQSVDELIRDLNVNWPNWGICGNHGVRWDGQRVYHFLRQPPINPQSGFSPRPALVLSDGMLLVNAKLWRKAMIFLPRLNIRQGVGTILSIYCLENGLLPMCSKSLFAVDDAPLAGAPDDWISTRTISTKIVNHRLPHPLGTIVLDEVADFSYLPIPSTTAYERGDVIEWFDRALANTRTAIPLTICCRTQLNRIHLLKRAVASFQAACLEADDLVALSVVLASDQDEALMRECLGELRRIAPTLPLSALKVDSRSAQTSRFDTIRTAVDRCVTPYIWFIDDDDFVIPSALRMIGRTLDIRHPLVVVGSSAMFEESWSDEGQLIAAERIGVHRAHGALSAFTGENRTPISSLVMPVKVLQNRLADVAARGEYLEDYFMLLLTLTSPSVELEILDTVIAGISLRGVENTVRETTRDKWNISYSQYFYELLNIKREGECLNPLLWQLTAQRERS